MAIATLTSKGQMTLPKEIRDDLGLKSGDKIEFVTIGSAVVIVPRNRPAESILGLLSDHAKSGTTTSDYDAAVRDAVSDHVGGASRKPGKKGHAA